LAEKEGKGRFSYQGAMSNYSSDVGKITGIFFKGLNSTNIYLNAEIN